MLKQPMIEKLAAMRLLGMAEALKAQEQDPSARELSFLELVANMRFLEPLENEWSCRRGCSRVAALERIVIEVGALYPAGRYKKRVANGFRTSKDAALRMRGKVAPWTLSRRDGRRPRGRRQMFACTEATARLCAAS